MSCSICGYKLGCRIIFSHVTGICAECNWVGEYCNVTATYIRQENDRHIFRTEVSIVCTDCKKPMNVFEIYCQDGLLVEMARMGVGDLVEVVYPEHIEGRW